jgi:hypothetical protein
MVTPANMFSPGRDYQQYVNAANTQMIPAWPRLNLGTRYRTTINARPVTFRAAVQNVLNEDLVGRRELRHHRPRQTADVPIGDDDRFLNRTP